MWHHGPMFWGYGGYGGWFSPMMIIFVIILLVVFFKWRGGDKCHHTGRKSSALDILDRRYANGEVSQEEYFRIKKDLE